MNPALFGVIALGVILGIFVFGFLGVMVHRWLEAQRSEAERLQRSFEEAAARTNLDDAIDLIEEIGKVRQVQVELKSAFAKQELEGGVKAALQHPLYLQAQSKLEELHDDLRMLI